MFSFWFEPKIVAWKNVNFRVAVETRRWLVRFSPLALINVNFLGNNLCVLRPATLHANFERNLHTNRNFFACVSQRFIISMSEKAENVPQRVARMLAKCVTVKWNETPLRLHIYGLEHRRRHDKREISIKFRKKSAFNWQKAGWPELTPEVPGKMIMQAM